MTCDSTQPLMMSAVDGVIDSRGMDLLERHIAECERCRADYAAYMIIAAEFDKTPVVIAAPDGFMDGVTARIAALPERERRNNSESLLLAVCGVVSVVFGIGALLALNRESIEAALSGYAWFGSYIEVIRPLEMWVAEAWNAVTSGFNAMFGAVASFASDYRFAVAGVFAVVVIAQFAFNARKTAVVAYADEKAALFAEGEKVAEDGEKEPANKG